MGAAARLKADAKAGLWVKVALLPPEDMLCWLPKVTNVLFIELYCAEIQLALRTTEEMRISSSLPFNRFWVVLRAPI